MPLVLTRIDDRLIHGQVIIGWGNHLQPNRIILCNDEIAGSDWQRELYESAGAMAMYDVDISIWTEAETVVFFTSQKDQNEKVLLLVERPAEINRLIEQDVPIKVVNVGGMHFKRGKKQLAPYIFVSDEDVQAFRGLHAKQCLLEGQDVPTSRKLNVMSLLEKQGLNFR